MIPLLTSFQDSPHQKLFFQEEKIFQNFASEVADLIKVDILKYLY